MIPDSVSLAADAASITGLVLTILVWYQTLKIRQAVLARTRIPQFVPTLERHASLLLSSLRDWPGSEKAANGQISECYEVLRNLLNKLSGSDRDKPKEVMSRIRNRKRTFRGWGNRSSDERRDELFEIQSGLLAIISSLREIAADQKERL